MHSAAGRVPAPARPVRHVYFDECGVWRRAPLAGRGRSACPGHRLCTAEVRRRKIHPVGRDLNALSRLSVVRLTKILAPGVSPLPAWFAAWARGEVVTPFSDLTFAPMSARFVGEALATIGEKRVSGNLHLSGAENVTYVDLAEAFARKLAIDARLIAPTTAVERGINILFKPRYSGLGMSRTTRLTGIAPQPLNDVVDDLVSEMEHRQEG